MTDLAPTHWRAWAGVRRGRGGAAAPAHRSRGRPNTLTLLAEGWGAGRGGRRYGRARVADENRPSSSRRGD